MKHKSRLKWNPSYLYIAPAIIGSILFTFFPVVYVIYLSLHKIDLLAGTKRFVLFDNYIKVFKTQNFRDAVSNTFVYMIVVMTLSILLALLLAVWLNRTTKMHYFAQTATFTPHIISLVSVSMLFMWMMEPDVGLLNYMLSFLGIDKINWLGDPKIAMASVIIVSVWKVVGYNTLILLAGLQSISSEIYESAWLDHSSKINTFFKITIPLLSPSLFFLLITNMLSSFQVFDSINVMTQGGPLNSTNVLVHWIYQTGFEFFRMGEAATGSVMLLAIVMVITFLNFRLLSKRVHYQ